MTSNQYMPTNNQTAHTWREETSGLTIDHNSQRHCTYNAADTTKLWFGAECFV